MVLRQSLNDLSLSELKNIAKLYNLENAIGKITTLSKQNLLNELQKHITLKADVKNNKFSINFINKPQRTETLTTIKPIKILESKDIKKAAFKPSLKDLKNTKLVNKSEQLKKQASNIKISVEDYDEKNKPSFQKDKVDNTKLKKNTKYKPYYVKKIPTYKNIVDNIDKPIKIKKGNI